MHCWQCQAEIAAVALCPQCGMPQPLQLVSHFSRLGLSEGFELDVNEVQQAYLKAQRQLHPDRFVTAPGLAKQYAMQQTVALNDAYHVLKLPRKRAEYLLAQRGMRVNVDQPDVKPEACLLMEMMELHEYVAEAEAEQKSRIAKEITAKTSDCLQALNTAFAENQLREAAQETIRLAYLEKLQQEVR